MVNAEGAPGAAANAAVHFAMAPLFMTRMQPEGTAGKDARFGASDVWPGARDIFARAREEMRQGRALDFKAAQAAFARKHAGWKAGGPPITQDSARVAMGALWVPKPVGMSQG
jgi:hypothetical protein